MFNPIGVTAERMMRIGRATDKAAVVLGYSKKDVSLSSGFDNQHNPEKASRGDVGANSETIGVLGCLDNSFFFIGNILCTIHDVKRTGTQYQILVYNDPSEFTMAQDSISGIQTSRAFYSQSQVISSNGFGTNSGLSFWNWIPGQNGCPSTQLFHNTTGDEHAVQGITHREKVIVVV